MLHCNLSQALLGLTKSAKDKELPPVPLPRDDDVDATRILTAKTLGRKNFKRLQINSSPEKLLGPLLAPDPGAYATTAPPLQLDGSLLRLRRQRPPPTLNLQKRLVTNPEIPTILMDKISGISPQMVLRPPQDLNSQLQGLLLGEHGLRRKQTVILSISPKKLTLLSPLDPHTPLNHVSVPVLALQLTMSSPLATKLLFKIENSDDLMFLKDLGLGNSGTVLKVVHLPTQITMAKKIIPIDPNTAVQTQIIRELRILHECHSPSIIEFYGAFVNRNNIVICMEYCNCGSLDKILPLCNPQQFPDYVLRKLAYSMLTGLEYLYTTHKIIHRDIKPLNVLMTHRGEFKLCDFGVLRELTNSLAQADTFVGTLMYMSPERIQGLKYGVKLDVWLMGLMLIELALGQPVWRDDDDDDEHPMSGPNGILDLLQRIVNETPPLLKGKTNPVTGKPYNPQLCEFIDFAMVKDEQQRKLPRELLADKHGWLEGVEDGLYDKDVRVWAKGIRKLHIQKADKKAESQHAR